MGAWACLGAWEGLEQGGASSGATGQHDLGTLNDRMRQGSGMGKGIKLLNLFFAENQRRQRKSKKK